MGLSDHKWRVLIALLCFTAIGFCTRNARAALNETVKVQPASAETKQDRQEAMEQLMQKMDESTKPAEPAKAATKPTVTERVKAPTTPVKPTTKVSVPAKPAETVKPAVVPAKAAEPAKAVTKPAETTKPVEPAKPAEPVKPTEPAKKAEPVKVEEKQKDSAKVNIDFTDVPLSEILATIVQNTDLNIIGGEGVSQKITVHLKDVPLDVLFDIILKSTDYGYIKEGKIIRIIPKTDLPTETEVFQLQFASAEKVMEAVAHLLSQKGKIKSFSNFSQNTSTNILIVTDVPESIQAIRALVGKLDKKVKQVMIEVKFCEVTLDKDDELGIDWAIQASMSGARGPTTFPLGRGGQRLFEPPYDVGVQSTNMTTGLLSFSDFKATLHALDSKTKVKLIANPQVAARSGDPAQIIIGDKIPIPTYERSKETGSMEVTGYDIVNVGILLQVTPFVNSDSTVTLNIHPEVSKITGNTVGPNGERPIISTREITTVFTVADGDTIVLGGLKEQTIENSENKVPFLGNIPLLGRAFFTYKDDSDFRKELLLFITPHILDNPKKGETESKPPN
jgi:type IV pilus assembly protein PilQ